MQGERPWQTYHVVTLIIGVVTLMLTGTFLGILIARHALGLTEASPDYTFTAQMIGTAVGLHLGTLVCAHYFLRNHEVGWREGFGLRRPFLMAVLALAACVAFLPVAKIVMDLCAWALPRVNITPQLQESVQVLQTVDATAAWRRWAIAVTAVLLAPITEEVLFRGVLYRWLRDRGRRSSHPIRLTRLLRRVIRRWRQGRTSHSTRARRVFRRVLRRWSRDWGNLHLAIWSTSVLFGLAHFNPLAFVPLTLFGVLLAWLYQRTGNLLLPMFTHFFFNLANYLMVTYRVELTNWFEKISGT